MAVLPESSAFDATVYEIASSDPVQGGDETTIANKQAKALADRTRYLKNHVDTLETEVASILATLAAPASTPAAGADDTSLATTAFVHRACGGIALVNCAGAGNITLTSDQWGCGIVVLTGARTGDGNVIYPTRASGDRWLVVNRTTGAFALTCKTASGAGVKVAQGRSKDIWCDGTDIIDAETDLTSRPNTVNTAHTLAIGEFVICDFTGGPFALTLPAGPTEGDRCGWQGDFFVSNLIVHRNGQLIRDDQGAAQAVDYVGDENNLSAVATFTGGSWRITLS
jgi:hypothetical protein